MKFLTLPIIGLTLGLCPACPAAGPDQLVAYDGLKKTISVDQFQAAEAVGGTVTADGLTAMLIDALSKDSRFVVVERVGLEGIKTEQMLGTAGATTAETAAKPGQLIGASAIVRGAVIKYEPAASGNSLSVGGLPLGKLFGAQAGLKKQTSTLEISLRLIDTTTGQVISTSHAKGSTSASSSGVSVVNQRTGASADSSSFHITPIGQAAQDAIVKAVELIAAGMRQVPWSALVVDASETKIYVNAGAERNMQAGMVLTAYHRGKVFTDPSTGVVLDVEMNRLGTICINEVRPTLSTAVLVSGQVPTRGDVLELK